MLDTQKCLWRRSSVKNRICEHFKRSYFRSEDRREKEKTQ